MSIWGAIGNLVGGRRDNEFNSNERDRAYYEQDRANKNAIQWRVRDAKAAGVHPLYAMGNPGISVAPVLTGGSNYASSMGELGQAIGSAVDRANTREERQAEEARAARLYELNAENARLKNEQLSLENQALAGEITRRSSAQIGPAAPRFGQGGFAGVPSGSVIQEPDRVTSPSRTDPQRTAGVHPGATSFVGENGERYTLPSAAASESLEALEPFGLPIWWYNHGGRRYVNQVRNSFDVVRGRKARYPVRKGGR